MKEKTQIEILISSIFALIINLSFSMTSVLKEALKNTPTVAGYGWLHPFLILCFFIAEIVGIYAILFRFLKIGEIIDE